MTRVLPHDRQFEPRGLDMELLAPSDRLWENPQLESKLSALPESKRCSFLLICGAAWLERCEKSPQDLDRLIRMYENTLESMPDDYSNRVDYLDGFSNAVALRANYSYSLSDLETAVALKREIVELTITPRNQDTCGLLETYCIINMLSGRQKRLSRKL